MYMAAGAVIFALDTPTNRVLPCAFNSAPWKRNDLNYLERVAIGGGPAAGLTVQVLTPR